MEPASPLCCLAPEAELESVVLSYLSFRVWYVVTAKTGQGGLRDFIVPRSYGLEKKSEESSSV